MCTLKITSKILLNEKKDVKDSLTLGPGFPSSPLGPGAPFGPDGPLKQDKPDINFLYNPPV